MYGEEGDRELSEIIKPSNLKYKRGFLLKHKGHHLNYENFKCLVLFCEQCKEFHFLQPMKKITSDAKHSMENVKNE